MWDERRVVRDPRSCSELVRILCGMKGLGMRQEFVAAMCDERILSFTVLPHCLTIDTMPEFLRLPFLFMSYPSVSMVSGVPATPSTSIFPTSGFTRMRSRAFLICCIFDVFSNILQRLRICWWWTPGNWRVTRLGHETQFVSIPHGNSIKRYICQRCNGPQFFLGGKTVPIIPF